VGLRIGVLILAKEEQSAVSMFQMPVFLIDTYYSMPRFMAML